MADANHKRRHTLIKGVLAEDGVMRHCYRHVLKESERLVPKMDIEDAAVLVLEAIQGVRRAKPLPTKLSHCCHHLSLHLRPFSVLAIVGLVVLTFFETPTWCEKDPAHPCLQDEYAVRFISQERALAIEVPLLVFLLFDFFMIALAYQWSRSVFKAHALFMVLYAVDLTVAILDGERNIRIAPNMRGLLLFLYLTELRDQLALVRNLMVEFISLMVVLGLFIAFFAFLGMVVFSGKEQQEYFPSFSEACWQLLVMLTTANFPDLIVPHFTLHRSSALFIFPVVIIGVFFLMNLVLASVFDKYQQGNKDLLERMLKIREEDCSAAFSKLDVEGKGDITSGVVEELLDEINELTRIGLVERQKLREDQRELLFQLVDANGDRGVNKEEFKALITLLQLRFERVEPSTFMELWFPGVFFSDWFGTLSDVVYSQWFEYFVDAILVVNTVLIITQSNLSFVGGEGDGKFPGMEENQHLVEAEDNPMIVEKDAENALNQLLGLVYCVEMVLKIFVYGWKGYWFTFRNCFDGVITLGGIFANVMITTPLGLLFNARHTMDLLVTARLMRVVRLMIAIPQARIILSTFGSIAPEAAQILLLLFITMYTFCVTGVQLYGGALLKNKTNPEFAALEETPFAKSGYWPFNFDDMASGMALLFCLIVVNNWTVFVEAVVVGMDNNRMHRWFFIAFYLVGVLIIHSVLVTVLLENFLLEWNKHRSKHTIEGRTVSMLDGHNSHRVKNRADKKMRVHSRHRNSVVEFKIKIASSVKMIEQKEVLERFLNLQGVPTFPHHEDNNDCSNNRKENQTPLMSAFKERDADDRGEDVEGKNDESSGGGDGGGGDDEENDNGRRGGYFRRNTVRKIFETSYGSMNS